MFLECIPLASRDPLLAAAFLKQALRPALDVMVDPRFESEKMVVIGLRWRTRNESEDFAIYKISKTPDESETNYISLGCLDRDEFDAECAQLEKQGCIKLKGEEDEFRVFAMYEDLESRVKLHLAYRKTRAAEFNPFS